VNRGSPLVLVLVAEPGCCGSFVLQGSLLVGVGCPPEGADAGSNRPFCGCLRCGQVALRRCDLLAERGWGRLAMPPRAQLVPPRADSAKALPDLLPAVPSGLAFSPHVSSMPAFRGPPARIIAPARALP
jgi:hypothetical protein